MISNRRIYIRRLEPEDAGALLDLRKRNRSFLQPFEPVRPDSHYTLEAQLEAIRQGIGQWEQGTGYGFGIFLSTSHQLIGRVNLSNVVRGAWQNCTIGYFLDREHNGRGYMTEAVQSALRFAFGEAGLHRVEAGVMPRNISSIRVLEKNGFRYIGYSRYHLQINGGWEDHKIYAITMEDFKPDADV
ncbi:GNAT family N-acetyltransferase [Lihuaxuella thermophila]|uniref:Ribosomal-protein-alanine N-acetyltransferase n=1 Tax=Lihuaxuella thermophila TaxID=1173111 RepID=A0A1H8FW29_9BACL|nr:GNAT family protein [Lihuaxuella thermophila]SEN36031.1 ribosomal-protein-alanine N-acetyltransferase [Lihuaxuella thermophila]